MSEAVRSFLAFDIDDEKVLERLSKVQSTLADTGANLKIVKPQNLHVTIKFLGDVSPRTIDQVYREMKKVSFTPFDMEIKGLGVFPHLGYMRVIWAGVQRGSDELKSIFDQLEPLLQNLGFKPERRGFSSHLTIARVRSARNKVTLVNRLRELENCKFGIMKAESLRLKKSVITPKGPIYSTIHEVKATESED